MIERSAKPAGIVPPQRRFDRTLRTLAHFARPATVALILIRSSTRTMCLIHPRPRKLKKQPSTAADSAMHFRPITCPTQNAPILLAGTELTVFVLPPVQLRAL